MTDNQTSQAITSDSLAIAMAAFEALNGPVETTPILVGAWAKHNFMLANPEKPKIPATPKPRKKPAAYSRPSMVAQLAMVEELRAMAATKTTKEMAAHAGWSVVHTQKVLAKHRVRTSVISRYNTERDRLLPIVRKMAATGATIQQMADRVKKNRKTIIIWIAENKIERGPKMVLK